MCVEGSTVFCQASAPGFVSSSCMFLDKKTLLQIGLNHGLNVIISRGTGPIQPLSCVACVLPAVVCKRMQHLGPAVHRGKNTAH